MERIEWDVLNESMGKCMKKVEVRSESTGVCFCRQQWRDVAGEMGKRRGGSELTWGRALHREVRG